MVLKKIVRMMIGAVAIVLAMALCSPEAKAQTQEPIAVTVSGGSGTRTSGTCPKGTGSCILATVTGAVQKTIGGVLSGGTMLLNLSFETDNAIAAPANGNCYPTQGTGSITSNSGKSVLSFSLQGFDCNTISNPTCLTGPLNFAIIPGTGNFATANGAGTFSGESVSCLGSGSADVQIAMQGVILK